MNTDQIVTFVSHTNKPGGGELALRRYVEATELPVRLVTLEAGGVWDTLSGEALTVRGLRGLRRALKGRGIVVANSMRAAFLTALVAPRGKRLVYWVRDGLTDSAMSRFALLLTKQVTARRATDYLANSTWTAQTVQEALGVRSERIHVVHSMCGVTEAVLDQVREVRPHDPLRLLFLGRIAPWKAPDVAIRALAPLRRSGIDAVLTVAGGSHFDEQVYADRVAEMAEAVPGVTLRGHVADVDALLQSHDLLVHCSTVPEPFGQVIVQGLAAGVPVVATRHGGPVEILEGAPTDCLYAPGDPAALARVVQAAVSDFAALSAWGRTRARAYSDERARADTDRRLYALASSLPDIRGVS